MSYYSDDTNAKGTYLLFIVFQVVVLLIVYAFVYTALVATKLAIAKYHLTVMAYLPVLFALFGYPVVLYQTRKQFRTGHRLRAVGLVLSWAAVLIVMLYLFLAQLTT